MGLTVGSWEIILALLLIGSNSLLARQRPEILGLVTALITGIGIDMWLFLLHDVVSPDILFSQAVCFTTGLVIVGLGTATYLHTNFAPIPVDRLTLIIKELTRKRFFLKNPHLSFIFHVGFHFNGPIGVGTLLTVCLGGYILHFYADNWKNTR